MEGGPSRPSRLGCERGRLLSLGVRREGGSVVFNALDCLIVGDFPAIIGIRFFHGVARVTSAIIAISFASLFAAAFDRPLTCTVTNLMATSRRTGEVVSFLLRFAGLIGVITTIISRWLGDLRSPRRIAILDNSGGAALGVLVSGLVVTLAALVLAIMCQALNQTVDVAAQENTLGFHRGQIRHSALVPFFLRMAPFFVRILAPRFPGGLPPILDALE